jgi:hypothetical protein
MLQPRNNVQKSDRHIAVTFAKRRQKADLNNSRVDLQNGQWFRVLRA